MADSPRKTVVIELRIKMLAEFPADDPYWDAKAIEFFYNESSHCIGNEIAALKESDDIAGEESMCDSCDRTEVHFIRDAEPSDLERYKLNTKP